MTTLPQLPAAQIASTLCQQISKHDTVVLTAPPGAGKSTLIPMALLDAMDSRGHIVMIEPRRLAARQVAERMATLRNEPVGMTVGYQVRFEHKISNLTRIHVVTGGVLLRQLIDDPTLEQAQVVIFDEFHERGMESDVALCLIREARRLLRPDLKIVIMSATLDSQWLCHALQAPLVSCEGRMFSVTIVHSGSIVSDTPSTEEIANTAARAVLAALRDHEGDILTFLPGEAPIKQCQRMLENAQIQAIVCPLYGRLSPTDQQRALQPLPRRKVVLATSIAETSLTIEGIRVVIDSGFDREPTYNPQTGLSQLTTRRISQDRADQRAGRAGRLAPGVCYRLYSKATWQRMSPTRQPEIAKADLATMLLTLSAWGEHDVMRLPWLTPPPDGGITQGRTLLALLGATNTQGHITPQGQAMATLPCHPRIAHMLLIAPIQHKAVAAAIAAILENRPTTNNPDLWEAIEQLRKQPHDSNSPALRSAQQYRQIIGADKGWEPVDAYEVGLLVAAAYPERIAQLQPDGRYALSGGGRAALSDQSSLHGQKWLAVAVLSGKSDVIALAAPIAAGDIIRFQQRHTLVCWNQRKEALQSVIQWRIGTIVVDEQPLAVSDEQRYNAITSAAKSYGLSMLNFDSAVACLQQRVGMLSAWHPELCLPDFSTNALLEQADLWLTPFIGKATTSSELKKIDLCVALIAWLNPSHQQALERLTPTHITVPTGSRIQLEYRQGANLPVLRVRLQECFGMTDTPRIDNNQRPVLMELLSPGFKPVQLTQDLKSFWTTTYFEVRKELRRRYPKHAWPDNPTEAQPTRNVKKTTTKQ
ncbi:MAG: ATP-dependent helicase HrpB [Bacteroidales bacterium]|nr:ATP-dependent helicase HrpB [Candidatus Colimorpha onthohippi]